MWLISGGKEGWRGRGKVQTLSRLVGWLGWFGPESESEREREREREPPEACPECYLGPLSSVCV